MLNKYKMMVIPFVSKKKYYEILNIDNRCKYSFEGDLIYIVDNKYKIVWERMFLKNDFEYRSTDEKMKKTNFYKNNLNKKIDRSKILPFSNKNIEKSNNIKSINDISFKYYSTSLSTNGFIIGSNSSGADKKRTASPILIDPRSKYFENYKYIVNAIKMVRNLDKNLDKIIKSNFNCILDLIESFKYYKISLYEMIENNEIFKNWINIINSHSKKNEISQKDDLIKFINQEKEITFNRNIIEIINLYKKDLLEEKKTIQKLRREFRILLLKYASENNFGEFTNSEINIIDSEAAHIQNVKNILKYNKDIKLIADPNNGLLLDPKFHTLYDKEKITFNENGELIILDNLYKNKFKNIKLNSKILNKNRIENIKERNNLININ